MLAVYCTVYRIISGILLFGSAPSSKIIAQVLEVIMWFILAWKKITLLSNNNEPTV
jgi:hypothetical protein